MDQRTVPQSESVEVRWPLEQHIYPQHVNQFVLLDGPNLASGAPDETVYLMLGHFMPPVLFREGDLQRAMDASGGTLNVNPIGSFVMSIDRLRELQGAISSHIATVDARNGRAPA